MDQQTLYRDIAERTDGDIYIGVVGPVRTGKSTFIKRFMELLVLPNIVGEHRRERATDELPQSGAGRTIMTTQPKFVPDEAVQVSLRDQASFNVRLVDCVGYLIKGVLGTQEGEAARMVRTPWYDYDIPFEEAAELGTRKVIAEHSTLGLVVTCDGTVTDIPRGSYIEAEERVIGELKALNKPFTVVLNTKNAEDPDSIRMSDALSEKYSCPVKLVNVQHMTLEDVNDILESTLFEFPISELRIDLPAWLGALPADHWLNSSILSTVSASAASMSKVRDHAAVQQAFAGLEGIGAAQPEGINLGDGTVGYSFAPEDGLFFRVLGEASGQQVDSEEHLFTLMTELVQAKTEYDRVAEALRSVRDTGYGLVTPVQSEMKLEMPEIVKQGGRFGVRLKASAPSLHFIRVDIQTEVSPIVGTEQQSEELVKYLLSEFENDPQSIWSTNMFGKSLNDLVREGLSNKLMRLPQNTREKTQEALQKIVNEGNGGMICILL